MGETLMGGTVQSYGRCACRSLGFLHSSAAAVILGALLAVILVLITLYVATGRTGRRP